MNNQSMLRKEDFVGKRNIIDPPTYSPVLDVSVPRSQIWFLPANAPLELLIPTEDIFITTQTGEETLELSSGRIIDLPHLTDQYTVVAYDKTDEKYLSVKSVDYNNNKVTLEDVKAGNEVKIFYPFANGGLQIAMQAPVGLGTLILPLMNKPLAAVHGINQYLGTSALTIKEPAAELMQGFGGWVIPEQFRLQLLVKSDTRVTTDPLADNFIVNIPYRYGNQSNMPAGIKDVVINQMKQLGGR